MARPTEKSKQIAELIKQGENSRLLLSDANSRLIQSLDVPSRIKSSLAGAPSKWLGGSLIAGIAASLLFCRKKKTTPELIFTNTKEQGLVQGILALVFTLSKPAIKIYATKLLEDYLSRRLREGSHGS
jgi:hypothetical protein